MPFLTIPDYHSTAHKDGVNFVVEMNLVSVCLPNTGSRCGVDSASRPTRDYIQCPLSSLIYESL